MSLSDHRARWSGVLLVLRRLIGDASECGPGLLRLDHPSCLATHKEQVVARTVRQNELTNGDAFGSVAVELALVLEYPARRDQLLVDLVASELIGLSRGKDIQT